MNRHLTTSILSLLQLSRFYGPEDGAGGGGEADPEAQIDAGDGSDEELSDDHPEYELDIDPDSGRVRGAKPRTSPDRRAADDQGDRPKPGDSDRLTELEKQLREQTELNLYLRGRLDGTGRREERVERREPPPAPKLTDEQQQIQEEMLAIFPHLKLLDRLAKDLFGNEEAGYGQLMQMVQSAPVMARQQQEHWDGVADRFCTAATGAVAKLYGLDKLSDEQAEDVEELFIRWVKSPKDKNRLTRYSRQDETLVAEFGKYYEANYIAPHRRREDAGEAARDERRRRLPQGGQGRGPVGTPKPKVDLNNEDAVHDSAWKRLQAAQAAGAR